jgi:hypothetical protein
MFEFQLSATTFGSIVRSRLLGIQLWKADVDIGDGRVIDHITVDGTTTLQRQLAFDRQTFNETPAATQQATLSFKLPWQTTVPFVQVRQRLTVHVVSQQELKAQAEKASQTTPFPIDVVFNVSASVKKDEKKGGKPVVTLSYAYDYACPALPGQTPAAFLAGLPPAQQDKLRSQMPLLDGKLSAYAPADTQFDVGVLKSTPQTAGLGDVRLAALATNSAGDMVALRLIVDGVPEPGTLQESFFTQDPPRLLGIGDWAFLIDKQVLLKAVNDEVASSIGSVPKFRLLFGPNIDWRPEWPGLHVHTRGVVEDVCATLADYQDMDVYADVDTVFSVPPEGDTLITSLTLHTGPARFGQELYCFASVGLLWPILGPALIGNLIAQDVIDDDTGFVWAGTFAAMAVPPLLRVAALFVASAVYTPPLPAKGANCRKVGDGGVECSSPVKLVTRLIANLQSHLQLSAVSGTPDGLVLSGPIPGLHELENPEAVTVSDVPFKWTLRGDCRTGFAVAAAAKITVEGDQPVSLGDVQLLSPDPLKAYSIEQEGDVADIFVSNPNVFPDYGCEVRVRTVNGVRQLTFEAPMPMTDDDRTWTQAFKHNLQKVCQMYQDTFTQRQVSNWDRDIHPNWRDGMLAWQIGMGGLRPDEMVTIKNPDGAVVAQATATPAGSAVLSLMFPTREAPAALSVERSAGHHARNADLIIRQTPFVRLAAIPVAGSLHSLQFDATRQAQTLAVADASGVHTWSVSDRGAQMIHAGPHADVGPQGADRAASLRMRAGEALRRAGWTPVEPLEAPHVAQRQVTMLARRGDETALFDVATPDEPKILHTYAGLPWYARGATSGNLLACYDAKSARLVVYRAVDAGRSPDLGTLQARREVPVERRASTVAR